ncbi:hypothetical protein ABMA32_03870 [Mesorhizobium sp. VNQ89]|uniref:hypothetical protein n=1 Tax=Mesorhizobium quangtriensis TaxID=3157709 RepID=UPI0032B86C88
MPATPLINGMRLLERLDAFAAIGATAEGGVNRQGLTEGDRRACAHLEDIAVARGYSPRSRRTLLQFCVLSAEVLLHSTLRGISEIMAGAGSVGKISIIGNNQEGMGT